MTPIGTIEQAAQLLLSNPSRIKPHVLEDRFIFSGHLFPFSALVTPTDKTKGPGQQPMRIPGTRAIESRITKALQPKVMAFGTAPTSYDCGSDLAALTADTNANLTLAKTAGLRKYSVIKNRRSSAAVQVQSVTSSTVVVVRAFAGGTGGTGLDAHVNGDKYDFLGNFYPDGGQTQTGLRHSPDENSNYLALRVTETDLGMVGQRIALYPDGSNGYETNLMLNARQHNEGSERNYLFGEERGYGSSINSEYITASKGLEAMANAEYDAEGVLTMDEWRMAIAPYLFQGGGGGRLMGLTGNTFSAVMDNILDGKVQYTNPPEAIKVRLKTIEAPAGIVDFALSQPMHEREGQAIFYDPDLIIRFVVEGLDMTLFEDVGPSDKLLKRDMYVSCDTLLSPNPQHIGIVVNVLA